MPLNNTAGTLPATEQAMVTYKFKCPDLAEFFETLNPEQSHIALEGALNIIFAKPPMSLEDVMAPMGDGTEAPDEDEIEPPQSEEECQMDHEGSVTQATVLALFDHQQGILAEAAGITDMVPVDDPENSPLYQQMEEIFGNIVTKLSSDITEDRFNQDVITLYGEMEFFSRIEMFTYQYNTKTDQLIVTISACNA
ncbi:hypothetical protein OBP_087 [Pseudomonas phage OBP]|uniref:hypothetical protein n=1 Tax=Pseudomonas phage OBP TaxID=1124849 RepID=UPI000240D435|nr:hypothetical protein OBP_087 [Pseudomonas phage OBP]AEV89524.1 hypothetical protein OBP_087 [Pseudomonas phage OBP]